MKGTPASDKIKAWEDGVKEINLTQGAFRSQKVSAMGGHTVFIGGRGAKGTPILAILADGRAYYGTLEGNLGTAERLFYIKNPHTLKLLVE
jgi:hypothetical protein